MSRPRDLVQGTLDLLILKILALEPLNGWSIGERLKQVSRDILQVSDGSLGRESRRRLRGSSSYATPESTRREDASACWIVG
jgi:hypothetical protein